MLTHFEFLDVPHASKPASTDGADKSRTSWFNFLKKETSNDSVTDTSREGVSKSPTEFTAALRVGVSGWAFESPEDFVHPWTLMCDGGELDGHEAVVALAWEEKELKAVSSALMDFLQGQAARMVATEYLKNTVLVGVASALLLPAAVVRITSSCLMYSWRVLDLALTIYCCDMSSDCSLECNR